MGGAAGEGRSRPLSRRRGGAPFGGRTVETPPGRRPPPAAGPGRTPTAPATALCAQRVAEGGMEEAGMDRDPADLPMPAPGLKTDIVRVGDAVVCVMAGDVHTGTKALGDEALREALALRPALLAVDLDAVELFTAEGLNVLLTLRDAAGAYGVPLVLVSPSRSVRRILDMTGAAELFTIHSTIAEAVAGDQP